MDSLFSNALVFSDDGMKYLVTAAPVDFFVARELLNRGDGNVSAAGLKDSLDAQFRDGKYFLLRICVGSRSVESPMAQAQLTNKMVFLQAHQELARQQTTGHLEDGSEIHPDLLTVDNDWVSKSGVTILFCFRKPEASHLRSIEFGSSLVFTRNQSVDTRDLEPKFRLKG